MLALLAKLFASSKVTDLVVDTVKNWVSDGKTSNEDKKEIIDKLTEYQKSTKHQSITRRFLAVLFSVSFVVIVFFYIACIILVNFFDMREAVTVRGLLKNVINEYKDIVLTIIAFYFGAGLINNFTSKK